MADQTFKTLFRFIGGQNLKKHSFDKLDLNLMFNINLEIQYFSRALKYFSLLFLNIACIDIRISVFAMSSDDYLLFLFCLTILSFETSIQLESKLCDRSDTSLVIDSAVAIERESEAGVPNMERVREVLGGSPGGYLHPQTRCFFIFE